MRAVNGKNVRRSSHNKKDNQDVDRSKAGRASRPSLDANIDGPQNGNVDKDRSKEVQRDDLLISILA